MNIEIICLNHNAARAHQIQSAVGGRVVVYHKDAFELAFRKHSAIIALMATGIIVREIAPLLSDKWLDPPVVAVDDRCTYAIPITGGHHGANAIAYELFDKGLIQLPIVTTATEAANVPNVEKIAHMLSRDVVNRDSTRLVNASLLHDPVEVVKLTGPKIVIVDEDVSVLSNTKGRDLVVGIGARRAVDKDAVLAAVNSGLEAAGSTIGDVRIIATAYLKTGERGITDAAFELEKPVAFVPKQTINNTATTSTSRSDMLGLVGVAEPCALALSTFKELVLPKKVYGEVTLAIAR